MQIYTECVCVLPAIVLSHKWAYIRQTESINSGTCVMEEEGREEVFFSPTVKRVIWLCFNLCSVGSGVILPESIDVGESAGNVSSLALCYTNDPKTENRGWRPVMPAKRKTAEREREKKERLYMGERKGQSRAWQYPFPSNDIEERKGTHTRTEHEMCRLLLVQQGYSPLELSLPYQPWYRSFGVVCDSGHYVLLNVNRIHEKMI